MTPNNACRVTLFATALLWAPRATSAETLVYDPDGAAREITTLIADARPEDASKALSKYIIPGPDSQFDFMKTAAEFKIIMQAGHADLEDLIGNAKYGASIQVITYYLHFPPSNTPFKQFVFLRYTFMKNTAGWQMSNFEVRATATFPPSGWTL